MRRLQAEPAYPVGVQLGEGPVWDAARRELLFVDIMAGRLYRTAADQTVELAAEIDRALGAALPGPDDTVLLVTRSGFSVLDGDGRIAPVLDVLADRPDLRFNDAKCDPAGRCFAGTLSLIDAPGDAELMRLDQGPRVEVVVPGVGLSNGLGWSPDGATMYFTDTTSGRVDRFAFDLESGNLGARAPFIAEMPGTPDGLCVDGSGAVWVALWDGSEIHRYTPDGRSDTVVELPVPHVTSCAFGGPDGDILFITTARSGLSAAQIDRFPRAGDVFALRPGASAPPATRWQPVGPT